LALDLPGGERAGAGNRDRVSTELIAESSESQDYERQVEALTAAGAEKVFAEKESGARADRPQLAKMMATLNTGDLVLITKIDRLGRSTRDLLNLIEEMRKAGANFKSLGDPMLDTTTANGELVFTILAAIATYERRLINSRTSEGRKRAQANGVKFGRKSKLTAHQRAEALTRRAAGETLSAIAKPYDTSVSTISRLKDAAL
jgi:DNA invertase Pin-like site-specific DNA recombinase